MPGYLKRDFETFPTRAIKRVERPTTKIEDEKIQRVSEKESGFSKAALGDYGPTIQKEVRRFVSKYPLSAALSSFRYVMRPYAGGNVSQKEAPIPKDPELLSRHIKEVAYFLRADAVGICALPPWSVYSRKFDFMDPEGKEEICELNHKYAIVILVDQDYRTSVASTGNDWISNSMSMMAYASSGFISIILADYIRRLGFPAKAHFAPFYDVLVPPLILLSGLGELSRLGDSVVHPFLGPRFKASVVTTDLPLVPDKPIDFGLQDFCTKCKKCARACPSKAISDGSKVMYNGYERWPFDKERCTKFRIGNQKGSGCGVCIKVCPWNKPYTLIHRIFGRIIRRSSIARRLAIWGDDLLGYGKPDLRKKWWFDLEEREGLIQLPKEME
ncbi:MAG: reductive dehalogenase [Desulfobacterota bacterium]|nr:reductive dehalogenase [Thermodesulfobacteriota bacterium]MDW8002268.1 reductive dehalogenase [Deltaproteobacteria bacterium]